MKKEREAKEEEAKKKRREEKEKKEEMETKKKALEEKKKEAEDKRTKLMEERKKAYAKRDAMLAVLKNATADAKAEKRAKVLADAAIAGKNITRMKIKKSAASKDAACDDAFAGMPSVNTSHAFCNATEAAPVRPPPRSSPSRRVRQSPSRSTPRRSTSPPRSPSCRPWVVSPISPPRRWTRLWSYPRWKAWPPPI